MSEFRRKILQSIKDDSSYIKDGLVFWLDGLDKQQTGNYVWVDKIGGIRFTNNGGVTELPNGFSFNGSKNSILNGSKTLTALSDTRNGTVEIVFYPKLTTNWSPIVCFSKWESYSERTNYLVIYFLKQGVNNCPFDNIKYSVNYTNYGYKCSNNKLQACSLQYNTHQYINTEKVTDYQTIDTGTSSNRGYCRVGGRVDGSNIVTFIGDIYEIRVYNRKLTDEERLHNQNIDMKRYNIPIWGGV